MKRELWIAGAPAGDATSIQRLDSLFMACEILKAAASGGGGQKWSLGVAALELEKIYEKIEEIRKGIISK